MPLPDPLTPIDCDLRGMPFMPLDVIRLLDSDLFALSTGEEFKAAVALWCKSWSQNPAGSVPNDDRVLAHLSSAGVRWKKIKEGAMRGWLLCSDNRWYHPVVAEKALEALPSRLEYEDKKAASAARKTRERQDRKDLFALLRARSIVPEWDTPTKQLRELAKPFQSQRESETATHQSQPVTRDLSQHVTAKTERGTETVKGEGYLLNPSDPNGSGDSSPHVGLSARDSIFQIAVPWLVANGGKEPNIRSLLGGAVKQLGADGAWELASQCMKEKPIEPIAWLAAGVNSRIKPGKQSRHSGFEKLDYNEGISEDGRIT